MRYVFLFANAQDEMGGLSEEGRGRLMGEVGEWWERHSHAGALVGGEQLQPASTATTVRFDGDSAVVTDGPFLEAKETIGGFAVVEAQDLDAALALARTWPARGAVEVRPTVSM
ncbi:MAG: YciI family protein [Candidatus Dormibacterales bacterium]